MPIIMLKEIHQLVDVCMRSLKSLFNKVIQFDLVDEASYPFGRRMHASQYFQTGKTVFAYTSLSTCAKPV